MPEEYIGFLKQNYFLLVYGVTWIFSVYHYKKYFDTILRYFPILIAYTFFNELLAFLVQSSNQFALLTRFSSSNAIVYNIYSLVFFPYFYFVYWKLIKNKKYKRWIKYLFLAVLSSFIINSFFKNPLVNALYLPIAFAAIVLVTSIVLYQLDKKDRWQFNLEKHNLVSWVSLGLFCFYLIFPVIFLINYFHLYFWAKFNLGTLQKGLIVIMYLFFCMGFMVSKRSAFR